MNKLRSLVLDSIKMETNNEQQELGCDMCSEDFNENGTGKKYGMRSEKIGNKFYLYEIYEGEFWCHLYSYEGESAVF